jgi:tetratricopeptide (TPR) repeat protein
MSRFRTEILISLILAAVTLAVYWQVGGNEFVDYDDPVYVSENRQVQAGLSGPGIGWAFTTTAGGNWHPLTWLSLQLDASLYPRTEAGGISAWGFHVTNLLLHSANAVLLFVVLRGMTGAVWRSAVVAALFAWHPLHVESVAWVAERKDVLSTLFWMLTLGAYLLYTRAPVWRRYLLVVLCFLLGLMAKPMLVTLPCVLLLLDYWPLGRMRLTGQVPVAPPRKNKEKKPALPDARKGLRQLLWEKSPLFALTLVACYVTWQAQQSEGAVQTFAQLPLDLRVANAIVSYAAYVVKTFLPFDLAVYYPHPRHALASGPVLASGLLVAAVTGLAWLGARRVPYFPVGWLWYLGTLVPVVGLVQVGNQALADRYTYVPAIGLFLVLAWGVPDLVARVRSAELVLIPATAVYLGFCLFLTWVQVGFWHNSFTLWLHTDEVTASNAVAKSTLGRLYFEQGDRQSALDYYQQALRIDPDDVTLRNYLGWFFVTQRSNDEAYQHFAAAARLDPGFPLAHDGLGTASLQAGAFEEADAHFRHALRLKPDDSRAYNGLGDAQLYRGNVRDAAENYRRAVEFWPYSALFRRNLACALHELGKLDESRAEYRRAAQLDPQWPQLNLLQEAWRLAASPNEKQRNGHEAWKLAKQMGQAGAGPQAEHLDLLAAACAEVGRFEEAVSAARKAHELAAAAQPDLAKQIEGRLRLYQQRKPYREEQ